MAALAVAAALAGPVAAQTLPAAVLADARALARQAAAALAPPGARIEVVPGELDRRLRLAPCERIAVAPLAGTPPWGRTRVGLRCAAGSAHWAVTLPLTVKVFAPALVARTTLAAGSVVEASQFERREADWAAEPSPAVEHAEPVEGRTLARAVVAGQPLRLADLRARQWFAAGDTVRIDAVGDGFRVSGEGQAMSNGVEGRPARVRTDGGRIVTGTPAGERRVEVVL